MVTRDVDYPTFTSLVGANEASDGYVSNAETASTAAMLTLTASGQTSTKYTVVLADSALTCDGSKTYSGSSIPTIDTIPGADGGYAVCVELKDAAGNITYGKSQQIVRDTNAPTVNVGSDIAAKATVTIDATVGGTPTTYAWTKQSGSGTITFGTPSAEDTTVYASAEETYVLRLTVTDAAGNSAYDELNFTWDQTPPTFTSLVKANAASDGYINAAEASSTADAFTLTAANYDVASYSAFTDNLATDCTGEQYSFSDTKINTIPNTDASYLVCVKLTDEAGNITYGKSDQIIRDVTPPTFTSLAGANEASNGSVNNAEASSNAVAFTLTASGYDTINYTVFLDNTPAQTCNVSQTYSLNAIPAIDAIPAVSDQYVICAKLTDAAGNITYGKSQGINRATQDPVFTSLVGANAASDGYINASEASSGAAAFTLSASDYDSESFTTFLDETTPQTCDGNQAYLGSIVPVINTMPATDGPYVICVRLIDYAGNTTYGKSEVITRDVTPPTFNSLAGANAASDNYINAAEASSGAVAFTLSASGYTAVNYTAILDDTPSQTCDSNQTYSLSSIPAISAIPNADDQYVLCVKLADAAGNITYGKSDVISRDVAAPGAVTVTNPAAYSGSTTVSVAFSGGVDTNFKQYNAMACTDTGCSSGCSAVVSDSSSPIDISATAGSSYYLCVQSEDFAGNTTLGVSSTSIQVGTVTLTSVADRLVSLGTNLVGGSAMTAIDIDNVDSGNDDGMSYTCHYDRVVDGAVSDDVDCMTLSNIVSFNSSTGVFTWTPASFDHGFFEIKVTGTLGSVSVNRIFVLEVLGSYTTTNNLMNLEAAYGTTSLTLPSNPTSTWYDTTANHNNATVSGPAMTGWGGSDLISNPYRLTLSGSSKVDLGDILNGKTSYSMFSWISPSSDSKGGSTIFDLGVSGSKNGLVLRQSEAVPTQFELAPSFGYREQVLALSPVAYLRFEESSGTAATDSSSSGNPGTYVNGVVLSQAGNMTFGGKAVTFDGTNDYVNIPDSNDFTMTNGWSMSAWIKPTAVDGLRNIGGQWGGGGAGNAAFRFLIDNGYLRMDNYDGSGSSPLKDTSTLLTAGTWYHVVAIYTGGTTGTNGYIYLNGSLIKSGTLNRIPQNSGYAMRIGALADMGTDKYFKGDMDDVALWNRGITAEEVSDLYAAAISTLGCRSTSSIQIDKWQNVGVVISGSTRASLYVNGREVCAYVNPPVNLRTPTTSLVMGATHSNKDYFSGKISDARVFGHVGVYPRDAWQTRLGNFASFAGINAYGLTLYFDAKLAQGSAIINAAGCSVLQWYDLLSTTLHDGMLTNFSNCGASSGWNGADSPANPARLTFDGVDDYVAVAEDITLRPTSAMTVVAWINLTSLPSGRSSPNAMASVITKGIDSDASPDWILKIAHDNTLFGEAKIAGNSQSVSGTTTLSTNTWYQVAFVYDGGEVKTYLNGVLEASSSATGAITTSSQPLRIGAQAPSSTSNKNYFPGHIANTMFYSRALTTPEIAAQCKALKGRFQGASCP